MAPTAPPPRSQLVINGEEVGYRWVLSEQERYHLASMLECEADTLTIKGNIMTEDREICENCGKHSGLDDLVYTALEQNIHTPEFMLGVLRDGPQGQSPGHIVSCSSCQAVFKNEMFWMPSYPW